jgi:hypothetical protein
MKLRRFTPEGIQAFREFLVECRRQPDTEAPSGLLEHRTWTEVVTPECQVAQNHFETKGEAARYLRIVLGKLPTEDLVKDAGLWTWLSLLYLESLCSFRDGSRVIKNDYYYIYEPANMRHFYRHLLFVSWRVLILAPVDNRLFLKSRLNALDKITERVMSRLYLIRIPCFFELLDRLYWDEARGRPRSGITDSRSSRPGSLNHRLPIRIRQLEKTYDLMSLTADQLLELLGEEFAFGRKRPLKLFPEETNS